MLTLHKHSRTRFTFNLTVVVLMAMMLLKPQILSAQIKVMNNGRVAMGTNTVDTIYKVAIDGSRYCALSLTTNHLQDYGWNLFHM